MFVTLLNPTSLTQPMMTHPDLVFTPISYSATDRGGYDMAEIRLAGPRQAVQECLRWLRAGVEISNAFGTVCWAGYVHEVQFTIGAVAYTMGLDELGNKVAVLYSYEDADGQQQSGQTDWAEDDTSQTRYGVRERIITASDVELDQAERLRDMELDERKYPRATGEADTDTATTEATLSCRGWWHTLEWLHYSNLLGREQHTSGAETQPLGLGFTSTDVGFTKGRTIQDMGGRMRHFPEGQKVVVSGSTSNNGTKTITGAADVEEAESYSASTISFESNDDILDSDAGLEFVKKGHIVEISGTTSNNGFHVIDSEGARHLTTYTDFGGTITNESAGTTFTIDQGNKIDVAEAMVNEDPGDSVTVLCYGQKIAQSFQVSSASGWDCARIGIEVAAVGSPTDDITVKLCSDSSGSPGTVLGTATIDDADMGEALLWRWAEFSTAISLSTSTTYWITIERVGSNDWDDFYTVGVDEEADYSLGVLKVYDGSAWQSRPTDADLKFRVWGAEETTAQIETMANSAEFVRGVLIEDESDLDTNQYRDGDQTIQEEIVALLDVGDSGGDRLIAAITSDRLFHVFAEATIGFVSTASVQGVWKSDGTVAGLSGERLEPGRLIFGAWLEIEEIPPGADALAPFSPRYVSGSEYDVAGGRLRPTFGQRNPFDFGVRSG